MLTALPSSFLDPLLSSTLMEDAEVRFLVLEILVSLIDRHDNRPKFCIIRSDGALQISQTQQSPLRNLQMKTKKHRACEEEDCVAWLDVIILRNAII